MTEMRGVYKGVRFESRRGLIGMHYAVLDSLGLGVCSWYHTLAELQAAVDAAIAREGEEVRLAE